MSDHAKQILFLTGTRADFGKLKSLIEVLLDDERFEVQIFATGMHMDRRYGYTVKEIEKCGYPRIFKFINFDQESPMDLCLARTIEGLSNYVNQERPDLIVVHGDRVETLAGAIVGALNNILVAHIEGGEVSGTVDDMLRHSISKLSHAHFVSNGEAKKRLIQLGEDSQSVFPIGSPDVDLMFSDRLPHFDDVLEYYEIPFRKFGILVFHPVTTEIEHLADYSQNLVNAINQTDLNMIGILPNNDQGTHHIQENFERGFADNDRVIFFPSIRFENFLVLLRSAQMIIGNSSAGVREASYYGVPSIDIGTRQSMRSRAHNILHCPYDQASISQAIKGAMALGRTAPTLGFGAGDSNQRFYKVLSKDSFWDIPQQKSFKDVAIYTSCSNT